MNLYKVTTKDYAGYVLACNIESAIECFVAECRKNGLTLVDEDINCVEKKASVFRGKNVVYSAALLFISERDLIDLLKRKGYKVTRKEE